MNPELDKVRSVNPMAICYQSTVRMCLLQPDSDMQGDRTRAIGNAALGDRTRNHPFRSFRQEPPEDEVFVTFANK